MTGSRGTRHVVPLRASRDSRFGTDETGGPERERSNAHRASRSDRRVFAAHDPLFTAQGGDSLTVRELR